MKKQIMLVCAVITISLFTAASATAQGDKKMTKDEMDMDAMQKSPHHTLMMAHHHSALAFAKVLQDMTKDGKFADVELARNAFAEIKHCMDQMDMINRMHMSGMSKEMAAKMTPMMAEMKTKMDTEKAAIFEHVAALEKAFQMDAPNAAEVQKHAAELVIIFEKMMPPAKIMEMTGKKPM